MKSLFKIEEVNTKLRCEEWTGVAQGNGDG